MPQPTPEPTANEKAEIHASGKAMGLDCDQGAYSCPYSPVDNVRHRQWMLGFSDGRKANYHYDADRRDKPERGHG